MSQTPERYNVSIPPDHELAGQLDDLVEQSEYDTRSEYVRQAILDAADEEIDSDGPTS